MFIQSRFFVAVFTVYKLIKFGYLQRNTEKIKSAFNESLIDYFTLQSSVGYKPVIEASGRIKRVDKNYIYIQFGENSSENGSDRSACRKIDLIRKHCEKQYFDITFNINRTSYQLQHRALNYLERHKLHPILIDNKRYDSYERVDELVENLSGNFAGKMAEKLNIEQKIAVKNIVSSNSSLPYLLFGPAGK